MKSYIGGVIFGASLAVCIILIPPAVSHRMAGTYSQMLDDCAVKLASDVSGAQITGLVSMGPHRYGICVGNGAGSLFQNNKFTP